MALNAERAAEERRGLIRWLRPEFQNPTGAKAATQEKLATTDEPDDSAAAPVSAESGLSWRKPLWIPVWRASRSPIWTPIASHWSSASPIRRIFREALSKAGLPYFNPHSFRNTLVQLGEEICKTPEQFKAWSQNLGHEKVLTTFINYGEVTCQRQGQIIRDLAKPKQAIQSNVDEIAEAVFRKCATLVSTRTLNEVNLKSDSQ